MKRVNYILRGYWAATGWKMIVALAVVCGGIIGIGNPDAHAFHDSLMVSLAIAIGVPVVLFIHYLAGTRPALPFQDTKRKEPYIPGVRNFDGSFGPKDH